MLLKNLTIYSGEMKFTFHPKTNISIDLRIDSYNDTLYQKDKTPMEIIGILQELATDLEVLQFMDWYRL